MLEPRLEILGHDFRVPSTCRRAAYKSLRRPSEQQTLNRNDSLVGLVSPFADSSAANPVRLLCYVLVLSLSLPPFSVQLCIRRCTTARSTANLNARQDGRSCPRDERFLSLSLSDVRELSCRRRFLVGAVNVRGRRWRR